MNRAKLMVAVAASALLVLASVALAPAQQSPPQPFAPDWAMLAGWDVFAKKSCGQCHSVRGAGGKVGPDLARASSSGGFFDLGAAMWNHLPRMGARMREAGIDRPTLTATDVSNLLAFLFTAAYSEELGDAKAGERLFASKGCTTCHAVGGQGGSVGPALDVVKGSNSPVLVAAAMWNHGPRMAEIMKAKGIERPAFKDRELLDVIAYVVATARDGAAETTQVIPGTPERGKQLFTEKSCAACHAVGGRGPKVGPALGIRAHHVSLTEFAGLMWNHGPAMWTRMRERGILVPRLTGQQMADIVAYLYTSLYFDSTVGSATRGQQLVQAKGCLTCHSVRGKGGKVAADFSGSNVVSSPASVIAAMWNHSGYMEAQAQKQDASLPVLTGQELADITSYLGSLSRSRAPRPQPSTPQKSK